MVKYYECIRCGYSTEQKARMRYHVNRVNVCPPTLNDINVNKDKILGGIVGKEISNICIYCNKEFSRPDVRKRHEISCNKTTSKNPTNTEFIYIFKLREHILLHEDVYKIGMTTRTVSKRLSEYPKGSICYYSYDVPQSNLTESDIIKTFSKKFTQRSDIGREYFEGSILKMIESINHLVN